MSEEIALAGADLAHIARLQERLNHWKLQAEDAQRELTAARAVVEEARLFATGAEPDPDTPKARLRQTLKAYDATVRTEQ